MFLVGGGQAGKVMLSDKLSVKARLAQKHSYDCHIIVYSSQVPL